jgi:hypothetical protein
VLTLLGTGLRFGELAGRRCRRVHLEQEPAVRQVVDVRYQAGRFGSGFKPRPKSDAGIREVPLAPWWSRRSTEQLSESLPPRRVLQGQPQLRLGLGVAGRAELGAVVRGCAPTCCSASSSETRRGGGAPRISAGWPENWCAWRLVMPALARDFQVVAVDQRGIGLTDKPQGGHRPASTGHMTCW